MRNTIQCERDNKASYALIVARERYSTGNKTLKRAKNKKPSCR